MQFLKTKLPGVFEIIPRIFEDDRGYFYESYNIELFKANGIPEEFLQDNQSFSKKGVIRGLHFQRAPFAQGKLVRVIKGAVLDVVVDIRPESPTFGQYESFLLTEENKKMVYLPEGFAHGFSTLEDAIFSYKCTNVYHKASEGGIIYNDPDLNIDWQVSNPVVSDKDLELPSWKEFKG
ncbi:dTDP-4-dehydrorhamnose 3,5-epimerase [Leadbetterella byssophila DSM 17132]|uniref:dTDP-4-dehydrorhamnose 3,5-epimerase n=1 Tax=Leadbetterella byssophila (strain DSM 17132 / JCM 16389 / KACC 11308 / NBRC 106382 / 4M15) TaxID=649349 RepID=E4RX69_LEAB4|nr:dTDP-4-dehydrorhamnose 3,5-epimerase [Leadbetterella byssophila]ADQ18984.1 dTDP-4-dehydrorhamnose 3,5-epimerase [Leadbetterella byssophila DSM 17132]